MKIKILFSILIFINAIFNIYAGKINEAKSFDEIFGQRWNEKLEENGENETDQNGIIGQTGDQNETNYGGNIAQRLFAEQFDQVFEVKQEIGTNCDQLPINKQIFDHFSNENDKKKREIVEKFHKIKEKIKQIGKKYSRNECNKIERKIAKKLGANQNKIYEWKKELGLNIKNRYSEEEKLQLLKQFDQLYGKIKIKLSGKLKGKREKCQKIIAKHLGTNIRSIQKWKKQLKDGKLVKKQKIDEEKREIVEKYFKIKKEFMQNGKHSQKEWKEFNAKINQMFCVNYFTIERWAEQLNIKQKILKERKMLTIDEKMDAIKQYYQIKEQNPKLNEDKIAKMLNIPRSSLSKYKTEFGN